MSTPKRKPKPLLLLMGPGLLLAATGVGGGDLATGSLAGSRVGTAILWAVIAGAALKYVVTEGLARWQLATGETLLEGLEARLGRWPIIVFLPPFLLWTFFVSSAQMSATGVTLHAMLPVFADPATGKLVFGIAAGLIGLLLVWLGGFALFETLMRIFIGVMFVTVIVTASVLWPGTAEVLRGLLIPVIPAAGGEGFSWTLALMGGVGGTLTVLCYGYWLREDGLTERGDLKACRLDLATGYVMTALFGMAMVIVGASITVDGSGATLLVALSDQLDASLGVGGKWLFLVGTFGAVFSSLLGVWQSVPYLFADCFELIKTGSADTAGRRVDTRSVPYRAYLIAMAIVPMAGLFFSFSAVQRIYAIIGVAFFPVLAVVLLVFNGRRAWVGRELRNGPFGVLALIVVLLIFVWILFNGD
jgi:Mn2+/Fe2+ NRAMP family transporter